MKKMRNEKGSIVLYVVLSFTFLLMISMGTYVSSKAREQALDKEIERIQENYKEIAISPEYTVTFDANGGTVDMASKTVKYGEAYGELPTPIREGYEFLGWNGKNLFNYEEILKQNSMVSLIEFNGVQTISWINNVNTQSQAFLSGVFKENTVYTISGKLASSMINRLYLTIVYKDGTKTPIDLYGFYPIANEFVNVEKTTGANKTIHYLKGAHSAGERIYIDINEFQIEEGTVATQYEPYYITSDTTVVQGKDHTLKAIWKKKLVVANQNINDYQKVEYIESTGTQYIDTEYIPNPNTKLEMDLSFQGEFLNTNYHGGTGGFLGVYENDNYNVFEANFGGNAYEANVIYPWVNLQYQYGGEVEKFSITDNIRTNRNKLTIEPGKVTYGTVTRGLTTKTTEHAKSMFVFGYNGRNVIRAFTCYHMRLYEMKISENGEVLKRFIPCYRKSDGVNGLYDAINNKFYSNSSESGEDFVRGPAE